MSDLYELTHPTGGFTVKVDAERRGVLLSRGYHDAAGWQAGQTVEVLEHLAPPVQPAAKMRQPAKPAPAAKRKPGRPRK